MSVTREELEQSLQAAYPAPLHPKLVQEQDFGPNGSLVIRTTLVIEDQYALDSLLLDAFDAGADQLSAVMAEKTTVKFIEALQELIERLDEHVNPGERPKGRHAV